MTYVKRTMSMSTQGSKQIILIRHGQAQHNPRAEAARQAGCSHETFLDLMRQDDIFDAELTHLGKHQAVQTRQRHKTILTNTELIVSSPLSRALQTADLVLCPENIPSLSTSRRVCHSNFREINGWLLNAKHRDRDELEEKFLQWNFSSVPPTDSDWTHELEPQDSCGERGYQGLLFLIKQPEEKIAVVSHGAILNYLMRHNRVHVVDGRDEKGRRFENCELRSFTMEWIEESSDRFLITLIENQLLN
jgi:broad specificity phosphatase PhoE